MKPSIVWGSPLPTWDVAQTKCTGYDAQSIVRKAILASQAVSSGAAVHERDTVLLDEIEYDWPLLASILTVRSKFGRLHLADFGGSLGSTYRQNRKFFAELDQIVWTVVEQELFVKAGLEEFQTEQLKFSNQLEEAPLDGPYNVILFASVLNYLENPWEQVQRAYDLRLPYLIVDRTHVHDGLGDHFRRQQVREPVYDASYPCRIFSKPDFEGRMSRQWRLIESWESQIVADHKFRSVGYFFARR